MPPVRYKSMAALLKVTNIAPKATKPKRVSSKPKKPKIHEISEHDSQVKLFRWADTNKEQYPELDMMAAVPNGAGTPYAKYKGKDGKTYAYSKERAKLVAEGLKKGYPDILLDSAIGIYHGLRIEMKRHPNKPDEDQLKWHTKLRKRGYYVGLCWNYEEARDLLLRYLNLKQGEEIEDISN